MTVIACAFHRWVRFAFGNDHDVYECRKCGALCKRPAGASPPDAQAQGKG
jgi:hypothetical protein